MHEELRFGETTRSIGRPVHATSDHAARVRVSRYIREVKRVLRNSVASSPQDSIMGPLIVLCCIALAAAKPSGFHTVSYAAPYTTHYAAPATVVASPVSVSSQYHAQDALGQYSYGYSAGTSSKAETKTFDGVTRGGYSYLDSHGVVQSANYVADDAHGFQVAATNLPKHVSAGVHDTAEVAAAKAAHAVAYNQAAYAAAAAPDVSQSVVVSAPAVSTYVAPAVSTFVASAPAVSVVNEVPSKAFSYSTVAASPAVSHVVHDTAAVVASPAVTSYAVHDAVVPSKAFSYSTVSASPSVHVAAAPAAVSYSVAPQHVPIVSYSSNVEHHVPVVTHQAPVSAVSYSVPSAVGTTSHQYHAQDELGQYAYGYYGGPSAKVEAKTLDGITRGGYSYVDGNGLVQSASYVADDAHGFRVAATNIPVGPEAPVVHNFAVAPVGVAQHVVGDTPEVVAAKAAHFAAHAAAKAHDYYDY